MDNLLGDVLRRCGVSEEDLKKTEEKIKRGFFNTMTYMDKETIISKANELKKEAGEIIEDGQTWVTNVLKATKEKAKFFAEDVETNWETWQTLARMRKFSEDAGFSNDEAEEIVYDYYLSVKQTPKGFSDNYLSEVFSRLHDEYSSSQDLDVIKEKLRNLI